jgi:ParB-like chromosome segregation protein Spo0J
MSYPKLVQMKIGDLLPNEKNPRKITAENRKRLQRSLKEFGNLQPPCFNVQTKKLIGGHQRVSIERELGTKKLQVWCVDLFKEKEAAAMLALNNHAGEWDKDGLESLLSEMSELGLDIDMSGFSEKSLSKIIGTLGDSPDKSVGVVSKYEVIVELSSESAQKKYYEQAQKKGFKCRVLTF